MSDITLEGWLRSRRPEIPAAFLPHLLGWTEGDSELEASSSSVQMARRGAEALGGALERPGRDREAAFKLLAADAFFTYACEVAVQEMDTRAALEGLLALLGDRFS